MIDRIQDFLSKYIGEDLAYYIVFISYIIITSIPIIMIGLLMNKILFVLICILITNILRKYTYGLHFTNGKCLIFTYCMIIIFSYLSKTTPTYLLLGAGLFCMREIFIKSPLKLTIEGRDLKWHQNIILLILGIILIITSLSIIFNLEEVTNGILCSVIMVDLTLFIKE